MARPFPLMFTLLTPELSVLKTKTNHRTHGDTFRPLKTKKWSTKWYIGEMYGSVKLSSLRMFIGSTSLTTVTAIAYTIAHEVSSDL